MAKEILLPALGMAQESGKIVRWLKVAGEQVNKGEPIVEIETDKATVELEATASGLLTTTAAEGDDVPVGQVIALIQDAAEREQSLKQQAPATPTTSAPVQASAPALTPISPLVPVSNNGNGGNGSNGTSVVQATSLATRVAAEYNVDLSQVTPQGKDQRIKMSDVVAYVQGTQAGGQAGGQAGLQQAKTVAPVLRTGTARLLMASPKARRLAKEQGKDLNNIRGNGPDGAILAADVVGATFMTPPVPAAPTNGATFTTPTVPTTPTNGTTPMPAAAPSSAPITPNTVWRIMAERTTQSWTSTPHFMLTREVNVTRLIAWREQLLKRNRGDQAVKVTYTDLLVKTVGLVLRDHPRLNASWDAGKIVLHPDINVGIAVASDDGLIVPVIHNADKRSIAEIAQRRKDVATRTQAGKIRPDDLANGTFTISNLGMYGVDAFNAIINAPQSAILAVGRIAERVVPVDGQAKVQPMMVLTLSCDHRVIDGARGAQFLSALAEAIEEPLGLLS